ncbi:MAG: type II toxin-antitoxin system VapC family toxin [Desulfobacterales bacterium]|nr:type II toxin-antitoxin system VapC family toxin [Desulfobacterales bacterium]
MKILLDTHAFLWFLSDNDKLSQGTRKVLENSNNDIFISIASFWEISIKLSLSKLILDIPFELLFDEAKDLNIQILHINKEHLMILKELPFHHKDPFDRLLIAQSIQENLTIVTADSYFKSYSVKTLW